MQDRDWNNVKGSPYSTTERRVPELIPVLCSQPAGDVSRKPGAVASPRGRLGWTCPSHFWLEVAPEIDRNPTSFYRGRVGGGGCSVPDPRYRFALAVSVHPAVGFYYFPPGLQLPPQPLRGLLPISLLGERRLDGCEEFA